MQQKFEAMMHFLKANDVSIRTIRGKSSLFEFWVHLKVAMRACRFAAPEGGPNPLVHARKTKKKMRIEGKRGEGIELADFARFIAPYCEEPVARDFCIAYITGAFIEPHKTGRVQWQRC